MNTPASLFAHATVVFALLFFPVSALAATQPDLAHTTTVIAEVRTGDQVVVSKDNALLMVGRTVLAQLPKGEEFPVTAVRHSWLGTTVKIGEKNVSGWVQAADVMLSRTGRQTGPDVPNRSAVSQTAVPGPREVAACRPVVCEPVPRPVERICVTPAQRSYGPGEWDFYWSGHFEPEPNIHTWEPWRHTY